MYFTETRDELLRENCSCAPARPQRQQLVVKAMSSRLLKRQGEYPYHPPAFPAGNLLLRRGIKKQFMQGMPEDWKKHFNPQAMLGKKAEQGDEPEECEEPEADKKSEADASVAQQRGETGSETKVDGKSEDGKDRGDGEDSGHV